MDARHTRIRAAIFLILGTGIILALVLLLNPIPPRRLPYVIETGLPVTGLSAQSEVLYRGVPVGVVKAIGFVEGRFPTVRIELSINRSYALPGSTFAQLSSSGLTSDIQLELDAQTTEGHTLQTSSAAPAKIPLRPSFLSTIETRLADTMARVDRIAAGLEGLTSPEMIKHLENLVSNMDAVATQLQAGTANLAELRARVDGAVAAVSRAANKLDSALVHFDERTVRLPDVVDAAAGVERQVASQTLPALEAALATIQAAAEDISELAALLREDPQALLSGPPRMPPGPGEAPE